MNNKKNLMTLKEFSKKLTAVGLLSIAGIAALSQTHVKAAVTAPTTTTPSTSHSTGTIMLEVNGRTIPLTPTAAASYLKLIWASEWTNHGGLKTDPYYLFIKQLQVSIDPQTEIVSIVDPSNGGFSHQVDKANSDFRLVGGRAQIKFVSIKAPVNYVYKGTNKVISGLIHDDIQIPMSTNASHPLPVDIPKITPTKGTIPKYANVGTPVYDAQKRVWSIPIDYPVVYVDTLTNNVVQNVKPLDNVNNDKIYPQTIPVPGKRIEGTQEGWRVAGIANFVDGRWEVPAQRISLVQYVYKGTTTRVNNSKISSTIAPKDPQNPVQADYPQNLPPQAGIIGKPVYDATTNTWNIPVEFSSVFVQHGTHNVVSGSINPGNVNSDTVNSHVLSVGTLVPGTTNWKISDAATFVTDRWETPASLQVPVIYVYNHTTNQVANVTHKEITAPQDPNNPTISETPKLTPTTGKLPNGAIVKTPVYDAKTNTWNIPVEFAAVFVEKGTHNVITGSINPSNVNSDSTYSNAQKVGTLVPGTKNWKVSSAPQFVNGRWEIPASSQVPVIYVYNHTTNQVANVTHKEITAPQDPNNPTISETPKLTPTTGKLPNGAIVKTPVYDAKTNTWNIPVEFAAVFVEKGTHNVITGSINPSNVNSDSTYSNAQKVGTLVPGTKNWKVVSAPQFVNGRWEIPASLQVPVIYVYNHTKTPVANVTHEAITAPLNPQSPTTSETPNLAPTTGKLPSGAIIKDPVYDATANTWNIPVEFAAVFVEKGTHNVITGSINPSNVNSDSTYSNAQQVGTLVPGTTNWKISDAATFVTGRWEIPASLQVPVIYVYNHTKTPVANVTHEAITVPLNPQSPTTSETPKLTPTTGKLPNGTIIKTPVYDATANTWNIPLEFAAVFVEKGTHNVITGSTNPSNVNSDSTYNNAQKVGTLVPGTKNWKVSSAPQFVNGRWEISAVKQIAKTADIGAKAPSASIKPLTSDVNENVKLSRQNKNSNNSKTLDINTETSVRGSINSKNNNSKFLLSALSVVSLIALYGRRKK